MQFYIIDNILVKKLVKTTTANNEGLKINKAKSLLIIVSGYYFSHLTFIPHIFAQLTYTEWLQRVVKINELFKVFSCIFDIKTNLKATLALSSKVFAPD